jgi:hypothetical protein
MSLSLGQSLRILAVVTVFAALFTGFHEENSLTKALILVGIGATLFLIGRVRDDAAGARSKEYTDVRP